MEDGEPSVATEESIASSAPIEAARPLPQASLSSRHTRAETSNSPAPHLPGPSPEEPPLGGADERVDGAAEPDDGAPTLSLDQLGVGAFNPFRSLATESPPPKQDANQRLQASLRQGSLEADRRRSLGPEGPVLRAAHQLVSANEMLLETSAIVDVRVDAAGRVTSVQLSSASSQTEAWRKLAERLLASLGPARLQLAGASQGLDFKLRLTSTMQLPSGAAPGVRLGVLGQTLREGGGSSSTSLSLSPTAPLPSEQVSDTAGRHQDQPMQFEVGLLKLRGDVTDVAASPRRVVQVIVLASNTAR